MELKMEIDISFLLPLIKDYFKDIIEKKNLDVFLPTPSEIHLKNSKYAIIIYGKGYHGHAVYIKLFEFKKNKEYSFGWLIGKGKVKFGWTLLTTEEKELAKTKVEFTYERDLLEFALMLNHLEKYLDEEFGVP